MEMTKATASSRKSPTSRREGEGAQLDQSRTRSSWRRARGEPRLIDPWRGGLVNVTQSNGSASLKCQLYPDKPSRFILIIIDKSNIKQCWRDSMAVYLLTGDD